MANYSYVNIHGMNKDSNVPAIPRPEVTGYAISNGQKIVADGKGGLLAKDLFKSVRVAGSQAELNTLATAKISMQEMLQNWTRISCNVDGTDQNANTDVQMTARNCYYYDEVNDMLVCPNNSDPFSAFISTELYVPNYTIDYILDNRIIQYGDDDGLCFICGFMTDSAGKYHTLSVWRMGDSETSVADPITDYTQASHGARFAICYDVYYAWVGGIIKTPGTYGGRVLAYTVAPKKTAWTTYSRCQVTKTSSRITAKTSDAGTDTLAYTLTFDLPSSKPAAWTQEEYNNIKYMMQNSTSIGFGTESNQSVFRVTGQTGSISESIVYDLTKHKKVNYRNGTKISEEDASDVIKPCTFLYSQITKKLYYIKADGNYIPIVLK